MQQRSADMPDQPDSTVRIVLGAAGEAQPAPDATAVISTVDKDATTRLEIGDKTVRIPIGPDDSSQTRFMPAPVITTGGGAPALSEEPAAAADHESGADHRPEFALVGIVAGVLGLLGQVVPEGPGRLVLLLVLTLFGPGAALLSVANVRNRLVSWALAVAGSLAAVTLLSSVTLWLRVWEPAIWLSALAGVTVAGSAVQFFRLSRAKVPLILGRVGKPYDKIDNGLALGVIPFVTLAAGVGLWVLALAQISPDQVGLYGFSAALGVPFVVGVVVLFIGFAVELFGRARPLVMAAYLIVVPIIMQATVPLLDGTIEYAWTYKHIGVVDLIRENGSLISGSDIYQQWPGFFAAVAGLSQISGVDGLSFAAWSSLLFALVTSLMTAALLRQFTKDRRVIALAVLLFQACMWVDIGYFSPQALVFALMLAFWVIVTRWLVGAPEVKSEPKGRIARLRAWAVQGMPARPQTDARTRRYAALGATGLFAAIIVSHQLTPVLMMVPLFALTILGILRPRVFLAGLVALMLLFFVPRLGSVNSQYSLFSFDLLSNASGNSASWNTPEQEFSATVSRALALGVWLAALIAVFLTRKRLGRVLTPALIGFLPMVTLVAGNYGGEAIYRVFAFSMPFVGLLIGVLWAGKGRRGVPAMLASGVMLAVLLLAGLQGLQGQLMVHQVRATDIEAAQYFYANAEPGSGLVLVAPNFPTKLEANYGEFNKGHVSVDISLIGDPLFTGNINGTRLPDIETYIRAMNYPTNYLVVSDAMDDYTDYFGTADDNAMQSLDSALRASANWQVFYQAPGVAIFKLVGAPATQ
ncbi:hypothetical protein [Paractinoplanes brasiliensis]|uniref:Uncharacterized protein n=1 Tax=Paractinoplanes brasiliensis TaxID=52695 RepID=A0A4R6K2Q0_9ACTN|nr:hypothetical protein [Actinoplanes brasiliensis]TDO42612.1 hypothetical protein C8E87_6386 [Actinoplanes brasiliensis]GID31285.1 hypothetical protein Abr02nite_62680 [Actinoplanes brasiliensis]